VLKEKIVDAPTEGLLQGPGFFCGELEDTSGMKRNEEKRIWTETKGSWKPPIHHSKAGGWPNQEEGVDGDGG